MEAAMDSQAPAESEEPKNESEDESLLSKAQELMAKITSSPANPSPKVLHALASMLEIQESRYMEESGHSSVTNGRASHNIGRLGSLVRDNDEFFELISSKFLTETRCDTSVRAAAARLLLSCSTNWMYPPVFEDAVLENIKNWVMEDNVKFSGDECNGRHSLGKDKPTDSEMLRTYAAGLLAVCLTGGGKVVEDVLTSGLSAKLMRFLRSRVLGETSQKDAASYLTESKITSGASCMRGREESRGRFRQVLDTPHLDGSKLVDEVLLDDQSIERDHDKNINLREVCRDECWEDDESLKPRELLVEGVDDMYKVDEDDVEQMGEGRWYSHDLCDGKAKFSDRYGTSKSTRDEDVGENARDDLSRRRTNRGWARIRGKGRVNEGAVDSERALTSPVSGVRLGGQGRVMRDRNQQKYPDLKRVPDAKKYSGDLLNCESLNCTYLFN